MRVQGVEIGNGKTWYTKCLTCMRRFETRGTDGKLLGFAQSKTPHCLPCFIKICARLQSEQVQSSFFTRTLNALDGRLPSPLRRLLRAILGKSLWGEALSPMPPSETRTKETS